MGYYTRTHTHTRTHARTQHTLFYTPPFLPNTYLLLLLPTYLSSMDWRRMESDREAKVNTAPRNGTGRDTNIPGLTDWKEVEHYTIGKALGISASYILTTVPYNW